MQIKSNLYSDKPKLGDSILKGATIGAGVGGATGIILGAIEANKKVKALPVESVTLNIKEPVYETKEIGKIPKNQYVPSWPWNSVNTTPTEPVYEKVPLKDKNGNVIYKEYQQTFQGHGKPLVNYETKEVKEPTFNGYSQSIWEDSDTDCYTTEEYDYYDEEYKTVTRCYEDIDGYWVRFYPKIDYKVIDTYQKPVVKFETGVSYAQHMILGGLMGAAVGGVIGGVLGAVVNKLSQLEKQKKENSMEGSPTPQEEVPTPKEGAPTPEKN